MFDFNDLGELALFYDFIDNMERFERNTKIIEKINLGYNRPAEWSDEFLAEICKELGYNIDELDNCDILEIKTRTYYR